MRNNVRILVIHIQHIIDGHFERYCAFVMFWGTNIHTSIILWQSFVLPAGATAPDDHHYGNGHEDQGGHHTNEDRKYRRHLQEHWFN